MTCSECANCVKDDGTPYCVLKGLYTEVALDKECDETDWQGNSMFVKEAQDQ